MADMRQVSQLVTQIAFAKSQGWSRSRVTQLKEAGRLVLVDGLVDVDRSLALIAATADPNRDDVTTRHAQNRAAKAKTGDSMGVDEGEDEKNAPAPQNAPAQAAIDADKISASYSKSRAVKEHYAAQTAKLNFEREVGKVCDVAEVERAGAGLGTLLRTKLESLSDRVAPVVAPMTGVEQVHAVLVEHVEAILNEIANELQRLGKTVTGGKV